MKIIKYSENSYFIPKQYTGLGYYEIMVDNVKVEKFDDILPLKFNHIPTIEIIKKSNVIDYYKNKSEQKLSVEKYTEKVGLLDKSDEDGEWENIDDEYKYKKFTQNWEAVYRQVIENVPVQLNVLYQNTKSEYDDIIPIYSFTDDVSDDIFIWKPDFQKYVCEIAEKYKFMNIGFNQSYGATNGRKFSFGRENSIEYMTMCGTYASGLYENWDLRIKERKGKYEELVEYRNKAIKLIDDYFLRAYQKTNESKINNVGALIINLESIKDIVKSIDTKNKTIYEWKNAIKKIDTLIEELGK
ncbi:MAG: hypothetical protein PHE32_04055 [Candidatus Shapirobacteria bacterium]|nr:hypothetical protein [Candidatus Shapirobacteria bacterium]